MFSIFSDKGKAACDKLSLFANIYLDSNLKPYDKSNSSKRLLPIEQLTLILDIVPEYREITLLNMHTKFKKIDLNNMDYFKNNPEINDKQKSKIEKEDIIKDELRKLSGLVSGKFTKDCIEYQKKTGTIKGGTLKKKRKVIKKRAIKKVPTKKGGGIKTMIKSMISEPKFSSEYSYKNLKKIGYTDNDIKNIKQQYIYMMNNKLKNNK